MNFVEEARSTFSEGRVNIFDQHRVNSFQRGRPFRRSIFTKLLDGTYHRYKLVWKQLLCYVVRVAYFRRVSAPHFKMMEGQITRPKWESSLSDRFRLLTAVNHRPGCRRKTRSP